MTGKTSDSTPFRSNSCWNFTARAHTPPKNKAGMRSNEEYQVLGVWRSKRRNKIRRTSQKKRKARAQEPAHPRIRVVRPESQHHEQPLRHNRLTASNLLNRSMDPSEQHFRPGIMWWQTGGSITCNAGASTRNKNAQQQKIRHQANPAQLLCVVTRFARPDSPVDATLRQTPPGTEEDYCYSAASDAKRRAPVSLVGKGL